VYVAGVATENWFQGTKDERAVPMLNCLDADGHLGLKLKQTFDYMPSKDECAEINLGPLDGAVIVLSVAEFKPGSGGRLRATGQIDRSTLPKAALETKPAGGSPPVAGPSSRP